MTTMERLERLYTTPKFTGPIRIDAGSIAIAVLVLFICGIIFWLLKLNDKSDTPNNEDFAKAKADEIKDDVIERLRREQGAKALEKRHKEHANETMQLLAGIAGGNVASIEEENRQFRLENAKLKKRK